MGIFNDLGFKKNSSNEIVSPNSAKFNGKTFAECQTELVNRIKSDVILSTDADGIASITNFTNVNKPDFFGDGSNIATYFFDGDVKDARGSYNGTPTNITYTDGKFGKCGVFNGSNSYINIGTPTTLNFKNGTIDKPFSISLFAKNNGLGSKGISVVGNTMRLIGAGTLATTDCTISLSLDTTNKFLYASLYSNHGANAISYKFIYDNTLLNIDNWNHFTMTYDGSKLVTGIKVYLNGNILINPINVSSGTYTGIGDGVIRFGATLLNDTNWNEFFNGKIDNVRIFNRALTAAEVTSLYNEPIPQNILFQEATQNSWFKYKATAYDLTAGAKVFINGSEQTGTSKLNTPDFFGDNSNIATYLFDGNVNDARGTYNGIGTNITYSTGKFNQCAVFNGTNGKITTSSILNGISSLTISLWVKCSAPSVGTVPLITNGGGWGTKGFTVGLSNLNTQKIRFHWQTGTDAGIPQGTKTVADNSWHHVVCIGTPTSATIYVDGVLDTTTTFSSQDVNTNEYIMIGWTNDSTTIFNGSLDNIRIFNRALTAGEVTSVYNEGIVNFPSVDTNTRKLDVAITGGSASKVDIELYTGEVI